jgi:hypothetical protein
MLAGKLAFSGNLGCMSTTGGPFGNSINSFWRHVRPPFEVIFCHRSPPGGEQCRIRRSEHCRRVVLGKASHLTQEFPIARNGDFGHAAPQKAVERIHMERASRSGHIGFLSLATNNSTSTMFSLAASRWAGSGKEPTAALI